ncbi:tetratricopeptide repeat protein [Bryobacter aggregatus]|uniref:tetratricopeptide repeat protein n=1 Tax=Bryobacter aggregatus TaxID=360054 RepID=UPI0004E21364|nr:tetratricopeptide repeat protein [Bryobacter aggregatus]
MTVDQNYLEQAQECIAAGDLGDAILLLEEAVEKGHESVEIAKLLARLSLRIDEVRAFQNWCHEALRMDPKDIEVHRMMEAYFRENGRDWEADEVRAIADAIKT